MRRACAGSLRSFASILRGPMLAPIAPPLGSWSTMRIDAAMSQPTQSPMAWRAALATKHRRSPASSGSSQPCTRATPPRAAHSRAAHPHVADLLIAYPWLSPLTPRAAPRRPAQLKNISSDKRLRVLSICSHIEAKRIRRDEALVASAIAAHQDQMAKKLAEAWSEARIAAGGGRAAFARAWSLITRQRGGAAHRSARGDRRVGCGGGAVWRRRRAGIFFTWAGS